MAQPSVIQFFNSRKRAAVDDYKLENNNKLLKLDQEVTQPLKKVCSVLPSELKVASQPKIEVNKKSVTTRKQNVARKATQQVKASGTPKITTCLSNPKAEERCVTPTPQTSNPAPNELYKIKNTITKSAKLSKLKESLERFKKCEEQLKNVEKKTSQLAQSPKLKAFNSIEFEIVSPQKVSSPEKPYLSPRKPSSSVKKNLFNVLTPKKASSVQRNLFNTLSPTKISTELTSDTSGFTDPSKPSLQLPFKYKTLSEIFRAIDTVVQIMFNRKEQITFKKLKPAVEEMVKRNCTEKHLSQIKFLFPSAFNFTLVREKCFGTGLKQGQWDLVVTPVINTEVLTTQTLLDRRRVFHQILIDKTKDYHNEFLLSLTPPMKIPKNQITRWHPEFDIEKVPEIELSDLPQAPVMQQATSAKEVLETARKLFNCNTRMNQALLHLKEQQKRAEPAQEAVVQPTSVLKGIPQALLEKVRQKQAAKALISMTRTEDKEKEVQLYSRLPELARLTRNLFVTEKKGVLELDLIVQKLTNSFRVSLTKAQIEEHLRVISNEAPKWLIFHKLRNSVFLKLDKNADLSSVINKLEKLAIQKRES